MFLLFKTVVLLSIVGAAATIFLILLKPLTARIFSAKWQYYIWIAVLVVMVFPLPMKFSSVVNEVSPPSQIILPLDGFNAPVGQIEVVENTEPPKSQIKWQNILPYIWLSGAAIYIMAALISYWRFLTNKKKSSYSLDVDISASALWVGVKKIPPVRICNDNSSPMLVGLFKPVIYLPSKIVDEHINMVLMHELTHCKRHDLMYKWAALIVNGIHWFNPFAYLITKNINEACEISCDFAVTKNMNDEDKREYMSTIVNLMERKS